MPARTKKVEKALEKRAEQARPQRVPTPQELEQAILDVLALHPYHHPGIPNPFIRALAKAYGWNEQEVKQFLSKPRPRPVNRYWPTCSGVPARWLPGLVRDLLRERGKGDVTNHDCETYIQRLKDIGKVEKIEGEWETLDGKTVRGTVYRLLPTQASEGLNKLKNPIALADVPKLAGKSAGRSDKLADKLRRRGLPVVKMARKNHAELEHVLRVLPPKARAKLEEACHSE